MQQLVLDVTYDDGSVVQASASITDVVAFELRFDKPLGPLLESGASTGRLFLAWNYLRRTGAEQRSFESWIERVVKIRDVPPDPITPPPADGDEKVDPTNEADAPTPS